MKWNRLEERGGKEESMISRRAAAAEKVSKVRKEAKSLGYGFFWQSSSQLRIVSLMKI